MNGASVLQKSVILAVLALTLLSAPGAAATETAVVLEPDTTTVEVGQTTSYDVVVRNASEGVGAVEANVSIADEGVATVANVSYRGNPSFTSGSAAGSEVRFAATGMDTADQGRVTLGSVRIEGETAGTTGVEIHVGDVSDEPGESYTIHGSEGAELTVTDPEPSGGSDADDPTGGDSSGGGNSDDTGDDTVDDDPDSDDRGDDDHSTGDDNETDSGDGEDSNPDGGTDQTGPGDASGEDSGSQTDGAGADEDGGFLVLLVVGGLGVFVVAGGVVFLTRV